jgi:uncharacterized membrane protein YhhN
MIAFFFASIAFAAIEWMAVATGCRRLEYLAKPAALLFLIAWFLERLPPPPSSLGIWFAVGLGFSLAGDVLLLVPGDLFLAGLGAFLLAHIAYVIAFNSTGLVFNLGSFGIAGLIALLAVWLVRSLRRELRAAGRGKLFTPVTIYSGVLALSLWSAVCTLLRPDWPILAAGLVALGAGLFFASDTLLAWNRFIYRLPGERMLSMVTYHLAQFALAGGVILAITRT